MTRQLFGFVSAALVSGLALLAMASQAQAFTVINQNNAASGGSRVMLADPSGVAALSRDGTRTPTAPSLGVTGGLTRGPGYGGVGVFDYSNGSTAPDNFPKFPGADNHLNPGVNAGMLNYGAIPGRDNWR
jgi:hypothetical protein